MCDCECGLSCVYVRICICMHIFLYLTRMCVFVCSWVSMLMRVVSFLPDVVLIFRFCQGILP